MPTGHRSRHRQGADHRPHARHDLPLPPRRHQRGRGARVGADRTFRTAPDPAAARSRPTASRDVHRARTADHARSTPTTADHRALRVRPARATARSPPASTPAPATATRRSRSRSRGLRPNTRYHFRAVATNAAGTHAQPRPLVRHHARADRHQRRARARARSSGAADLTLIGRIRGTGVGGTRVVLQRQGFPFQSGFAEVARKTASSDGAFQFNVNSLFETTHLRVVTRHQASRSRAPSTRRRARSRSARGRARGAAEGERRGRDLAERAERPRVAAEALAARALGGGHAPGGAAARRHPLALQLQREAGEAREPASRYRVVVLARDGGAHVPGRCEASAREEAAQEALVS